LAGILLRPRGVAEWVWAAAGAAALVVFGLLPLPGALAAVRRGSDVYLFLTGMMLLAEIARREGVFDWVAAHAVRAARGSGARLFALVYGTGVVVTAVLSNDATAVVLTPAVAAAVRGAGARPLPYLFACAFVANAASFILPISNPANLVVYGSAMPPLGSWLRALALPSAIAAGATYAALAWLSREDLRRPLAGAPPVPALGSAGRTALAGIAFTALALLVASARGAGLGAVTAVAAVLVLGAAGCADRPALLEVPRRVSWSILILVAGLFVMVAALDRTGLLNLARRGAELAAQGPLWSGAFAVATAAALVSNVANNLPSGLVAGTAVAGLHGAATIVNAAAVGIDLGPNLSVTGSLATVLWLTELRRESIELDALTFLRAGAIVMPPALLLAVAALCLEGR
jgi:arsenical pump membrane protein